MAEASGGNFYFIETPANASQVFLIEGESLTSIAAEALTVTLTPAAGSGVELREVSTGSRRAQIDGGGLVVTLGEVYAAEDKLLSIELAVPAQGGASERVPLVNVSFGYVPVGSDEQRANRVEERLEVAAPAGGKARPAPFDVLHHVARIRIARAKESAVSLYDAGKSADAARVFRELVEQLRQQELDEEFEIAEEVGQLEYFADRLEKGRFGGDDRKVLRDQSYQGRTRNRADLSTRGGLGGSAGGLDKVDAVGDGVELRCVREGGKLRVQAVSEGYEPDFAVLFPRAYREEGAHYVVDGLELSKNGTFYRVRGTSAA